MRPHFDEPTRFMALLAGSLFFASGLLTGLFLALACACVWGWR